MTHKEITPGIKIRQRLKERKLNALHLADKLGITNTAVNARLRRTGPWSKPIAKRYREALEALGVPTQYLFKVSEKKERSEPPIDLADNEVIDLIQDPDESLECIVRDIDREVSSLSARLDELEKDPPIEVQHVFKMPSPTGIRFRIIQAILLPVHTALHILDTAMQKAGLL